MGTDQPREPDPLEARVRKMELAEARCQADVQGSLSAIRSDVAEIKADLRALMMDSKPIDIRVRILEDRIDGLRWYIRSLWLAMLPIALAAIYSAFEILWRQPHP